MPNAGAGRPAFRSTSPNAPRSSARSIAAAEVPTTGTPAAVRRSASASGVWPPSCTITPGDRAGLLLGVHDLEHVLEGQRLEVEPVRGVVVRGDGLRVAVDHHGLEPRLAQRHHRVHARVVELDALADPVRPRAEDQHLRALGLRGDLRLGSRVGLVGAVVVRRARRELGGARVDGLVDRPDAEPVPQRAHPVLAGELRAQRGELAVRDAGPLGPAQQRRVEHRRVLDLGAQLGERRDLVDEPRVDPGARRQASATLVPSRSARSTA